MTFIFYIETSSLQLLQTSCCSGHSQAYLNNEQVVWAGPHNKDTKHKANCHPHHASHTQPDSHIMLFMSPTHCCMSSLANCISCETICILCSVNDPNLVILCGRLA